MLTAITSDPFLLPDTVSLSPFVLETEPWARPSLPSPSLGLLNWCFPSNFQVFDSCLCLMSPICTSLCLSISDAALIWSLEAQLPTQALDSLLLPTFSQIPRVIFPVGPFISLPQMSSSFPFFFILPLCLLSLLYIFASLPKKSYRSSLL